MSPETRDAISHDEVEFRVHVSESLARIETKVDQIKENDDDQFDRLGKVENRVSVVETGCARNHGHRLGFLSMIGLLVKALK